MAKELFARKCQDGWLIEIMEKLTVKTKSDVLVLIRQNGLKKQKELLIDHVHAI